LTAGLGLRAWKEMFEVRFIEGRTMMRREGGKRKVVNESTSQRGVVLGRLLYFSIVDNKRSEKRRFLFLARKTDFHGMKNLM
jgi:hypothetical protein